jgi:phosphoribosylaminoimidazolecarboxamide formyltransferase/IMP cyclohydrolase
MAQIKTALVSVSDKTGLVEFARRLRALDVRLLSTGGTARLLREKDIEVQDVSEYTGFPEILDGRVKTLHPKVHGGLLAMRGKEEHRRQMAEHGIDPIDMVVVNLYPFETTIARPNVELGDAIENIDIGGPTMIRSAAKNYLDVAVVVNPGLYDEVASQLESNDGQLTEDMHFRLALEAFRHTAHYDRAIANYLGGLGSESPYPDMFVAEGKLQQTLRYGENPHQSAAFYVQSDTAEPSISNAEQIHGPALSFNNILDANAALELVKEFSDPAAICIKHTNPCGAATGKTLRDAYIRAYEGDPVSAFGCVIALNRPLDPDTAEAIANYRATREDKRQPYFVEVIIAPDVEDAAVRRLLKDAKWAERTRILKTGPLDAPCDKRAMDVRRVVGGYLVQDRDLAGWDESSLKQATTRKPTEQEMRDLRFAWLCCKHVKSNAIVLVKDQMLVGLGAGQTSRVDSAVIAAHKAGDRAEGSVLASDAFFPFPDAMEAAAKVGVTAIVQPGGAKNDDDVIAAADRCEIAMLLTGVRHFRH